LVAADVEAMAVRPAEVSEQLERSWPVRAGEQRHRRKGCVRLPDR